MTRATGAVGTLDPVLRRLADEIADFEAAVDELPVAPAVTPAQIRERLSAYDFAQPVSEVHLSGPTVALRACITSHRARPADLDILVEELERAIRPA